MRRKKRLARGKGPSRGSTPIPRHTRSRRSSRGAEETARIYGSVAFRRWFYALPCACCGRVGQTEAAHSVGGGMGRKADWTTLVPLCPTCHRFQHQVGARSFALATGVDLRSAAEAVQRAWAAKTEGKA